MIDASIRLLDRWRVLAGIVLLAAVLVLIASIPLYWFSPFAALGAEFLVVPGMLFAWARCTRKVSQHRLAVLAAGVCPRCRNEQVSVRDNGGFVCGACGRKYSRKGRR